MGIFDKFRKKKDTGAKGAEKEKTEPVNAAEEAVSEVKPSGNSDVVIPASAATAFRRSSDAKIEKDSSVYKLWDIYNTQSKRELKFDVFEYMDAVLEDINEAALENNADKTENELITFIKEIHKQCDAVLKSEKDDEKSPVNAEPMFHMTRNKLRLWLIVFPPLHGGADITEQDIRFRMDSQSVKYGIDNNAISKVVSEKDYMKIVQIALGKDATYGQNGTYTCNFSKQSNNVNIKEDIHGNVNYKELNMIQSVHKGDVICDIVLPTTGSDGMTVTGETIAGRDGKYPAVPAGKNTEFTEDKTQLLAKIDGEVVYEGGKFSVRNLLTIKSDVDNAVGNINFTGDVLINGDVREGYTVKAEGDIHITGTVEGATVIGGGDLQIDRGMTGGNKGVIEIQGKLKCRYLENCKVYAKEGVEADQLIYCKLSTDKDIILKGKKGSVTGGRLVAGGKIEAMAIGTIANTTLKTEIVLGVIPHLIEQEKELRQRFEAAQDSLVKLTQDITYINNNIKQANEERKELLKKLLFQYQVDQMKNKKLEAELEEISEKIKENTENCSLKADRVYPVLHLSVCGVTQVINQEITGCKVFRKDNKTYVSGTGLSEHIVF